jgi:hypothetical protein
MLGTLTVYTFKNHIAFTHDQITKVNTARIVRQVTSLKTVSHLVLATLGMNE